VLFAWILYSVGYSFNLHNITKITPPITCVGFFNIVDLLKLKPELMKKIYLTQETYDNTYYFKQDTLYEVVTQEELEIIKLDKYKEVKL
tara:strand:- start:18415 stop:18681 length:267 start_codon:yes stop_codon:yes gene_type:complete